MPKSGRQVSDSFEMSSVTAGEAKNQLAAALASAEKQLKAVSANKNKLSDKDKQVKAVLHDSAELLLRDVKKHLARGSYSTVVAAIDGWRQQRARELDYLQASFKSGNLGLAPVAILVGFIDAIYSIADDL